MTQGIWHRRIVHDLVFEIEGTGWHAPEIRDNTGYRWTGPGRFSTLRIPSPDSAGRGELHLLAPAGMRPPPTELFLNGTRLATQRRETGTLTILDFAWSEPTIAGQPKAEFWLDVSGLRQQPFQSGQFRSVGIAATCLILEPAATAGTEREHGPALLAGRRFLDQHLGFRTGPLRLALRGGGAELRLENLAIGSRAIPALTLALRPDLPELILTLPETPPLRCTPAAAGLAITPDPGLAERLRIARLLGELPTLFGRWLDDATRGSGGAPALAIIAPCRTSLAEFARAAERDLAASLTGEADPFAALLSGGSGP